MPHYKDWGAVLSQRDKHGWSRVIAYANKSLHPNEKKMRNYSLAKLRLFALKWAMLEKLWDYLLGSKFTVYMDNNPLAYLRESKLGGLKSDGLVNLHSLILTLNTEQVRSNKASDVLSHLPYVPEQMDNDSKSEQYKTISHAVDCEELEEMLDGQKPPRECKMAIQNKENKPAQQELELHSSVIEVLSKVSPSEMMEAQQADPTIGQVVQWVKAGNKPKLSQIRTKI